MLPASWRPVCNVARSIPPGLQDDQRAVRLMFEVVFQVNGRTHYGSAVSQAIFNGKLHVLATAACIPAHV
jgi:hypothetical protein